MTQPKEFQQILTDGGVGDLICELVAVDWNIRNHPSVHFHVWVPDYLLSFAKHVLSPGATVRPFSKAKSKFRSDIEGMTTEWCTNHTAMRTHPVDYGFHMLSDRHIYDLNQKNYLQIIPQKPKTKLPQRYVTIAATAAEPVKAMPVETLNAIIDYVVGKGYTPVFLGREESHTGLKDFKVKSRPIPIDYSKGINLINKTDLLEAAQIISGSQCFIGMDGGLTHLAGCTNTNIVAGYTLVDPIHVAPIRFGTQNYRFYPVEPSHDIANRYYQTWNSGFKKGDFRVFPGWEKVVADMTPEKFIKKLEGIL